MVGHRRHRLVVEVEHDGHIRVELCERCTDPVEALHIVNAIRRHMEPLATVYRRAPGPAPVANEGRSR